MRKTQIALAIAASLISSASFAAASAQASLSQLSIQLIDLNPNDGITPWISFDQGVQSSVEASATQPLASQSGSAGAFGAFSSASTSASVALAWANANVGASALQASGHASGLTPELVGYGSTSFSAQANALNWSGGFTLSANTLLVLSGQGFLQASTTIGVDEVSWQGESANASMQLSISGAGADGNGTQSSDDSLFAYASYTYGPDAQGNWGWQPQTMTLQDSVTVSFLNISGSNSLSGTMNARVSVSGYSPLSAVPEPGSFAMLFGGLGLLGWLGRRQRRA